jgi:hypothetical protein
MGSGVAGDTPLPEDSGQMHIHIRVKQPHERNS